MPRRFLAAFAVVVLAFAGVGMLPAAAQGPSPDATVVDELGPGFSPRGPGWHDAAGGYENHHYWTFATKARPARVGTWRGALPAAGLYRVEAMIPLRHATTHAARYRIGTTDGLVLRPLNQSRTRGSWVSLGTYDLPMNAAVRLSARTGDPRGQARQVAFDALRFVPVETLAPPVIRGIAVEPRSDRAIITFRLDAKGPARTEYREQGASDWLAGPSEASYDYADHRQVITGLRPSTDYQLRVIATNAAGTTTSDVVPFTTTAPPPPVIRGIEVTPEEARAVVTFSLDAKGPARTEYRRRGASEWLPGSSETSSRFADHRQVIRDLRPETDYEVRVIATNTGGNTVSPAIGFRTLMRTVNCGAGEDLAAAVREARSGDTLLIRGMCTSSDYRGVVVDKDLTLKGDSDGATLGVPVTVQRGVDTAIADLRLMEVGLGNEGTLRLARVSMASTFDGLVNSGTMVLADSVLAGVNNPIHSSAGSVTVIRSTITGCQTRDYSPKITNAAGSTMVFRDSEVSDCGQPILNEGDMEFVGSRLLRNFDKDNTTSSGIVNRGTLRVTDSTFRANSTPEGSGGALFNHGVATVTDTLIVGNSAGRGGGIDNQGDLTLVDVSLNSNTARDTGGGIYNLGSISLTRVQMSSNTPNDCTGCE